jgi:hypothetical protein
MTHIPISKATFQQMNPSLDENCLSLDHFSLVHSLSDTTLRAAGNLAYLKLEKENLALRDQVDDLQCLFC